MARRKCSNCYFGDQCGSKSTCEYYTPLTEEAEKNTVIELINNRRPEFRRAWAEYISGDDPLAFRSYEWDAQIEGSDRV